MIRITTRRVALVVDDSPREVAIGQRQLRDERGDWPSQKRSIRVVSGRLRVDGGIRWLEKGRRWLAVVEVVLTVVCYAVLML
ncbi:hypothetical protein U1Q18_010391 [Sarracenia purpurea var. burkii]